MEMGSASIVEAPGHGPGASPPRKRGSIAFAVDSRLRGNDRGPDLLQCVSP